MFDGLDWTDIIVEYYMDGKDGIKEIQKAIQKLKEVLEKLGEEPYIIVCEIKNCIEVLEICMNIIKNYNVSLEDLQLKAKEKGIILTETADSIKFAFRRTPIIRVQSNLELYGFCGKYNSWEHKGTSSVPSMIYHIDKLLDHI